MMHDNQKKWRIDVSAFSAIASHQKGVKVNGVERQKFPSFYEVLGPILTGQ
jgi:hypothetical protein